MGTQYGHLFLKERSVIEHLHREGVSNTEIARRTGRHKSTIGRELVRNSRATRIWRGGYDAERADGLALRRRLWDARYKLARQPDLRNQVGNLLAMGWSPQQIAGRLALEAGHTVISHESIYRFVYHRTAQQDYWHKLLPRAKFSRGIKKRREGSAASFIKHRRPLSERSDMANDRCQCGHWEADLISFSKYGHYMLTLHERTSRVTLITRLESKSAAHVAHHLRQWLDPLDPDMRRSVVFDNGTEFAEHHTLPKPTQTFFCDVRSPWQKGGVENANGRLRRWLPRKTDLDELSPGQIEKIARCYNNTPRKCLGYKTPTEAFKIQLLHFNRESTSPLVRE